MTRITKKQEQEMMDVQNAKRAYRTEFINAIRSYWEDVRALERVYKMDKEANADKFKRNGRLVDEESNKALARYEILNDLPRCGEDDENRRWTIARLFVHNNEENRNLYMISQSYGTNPEFDDIVMNDIIWDENEINTLLEMTAKCGYKRIQLFDESTAVNRALYMFLNKGCKVVGTNELYNEMFGSKRLERTGLIIEL